MNILPDTPTNSSPNTKRPYSSHWNPAFFQTTVLGFIAGGSQPNVGGSESSAIRFNKYTTGTQVLAHWRPNATGGGYHEQYSIV